jgi:hypothetical protein
MNLLEKETIARHDGIFHSPPDVFAGGFLKKETCIYSVHPFRARAKKAGDFQHHFDSPITETPPPLSTGEEYAFFLH